MGPPGCRSGLPGGDTFRGLLIKGGGPGGISTVILKATHRDGFFVEALADGELISDGDGFRRLRALPIAVHLPPFDGGLGFGTGPEEARGPKPFV
jgi:hypothetical protein